MTSSPPIPIEACPPHRMDEIRALFVEYEQVVGVDLCFQQFDRELENLPGDYAPPGGRLLIATSGDAIAGCVALRRLTAEDCEMKRLYVRAEYTGHGLGRRLACAIIDAARDIDYSRMRLDTLPSMTKAIALYRALRFVDTDPYYPNPIRGAVYMELDLRKPGRGIDAAAAQVSP